MEDRPVNNDRAVLWIGHGDVQYDSDTVPTGRRFPTMRLEAFARWAKAHSPDCQRCVPRPSPLDSDEAPSS